jgi:hypothetical protein
MNKRVLQISLDILVGAECNGVELAEFVQQELNRRGFNVLGAEFQHDMTKTYVEQYPELFFAEELSMLKFDWQDFTEAHYNKYINNPFGYDDYIGAVHIGDICIDLLIQDDNILTYDFYVAHEDTGYAYKDDVLPYDYADGDAMDMPVDLSYEEFKAKAEKLFTEYMCSYRGNRGSYHLIEHANRPLEVW